MGTKSHRRRSRLTRKKRRLEVPNEIKVQPTSRPTTGLVYDVRLAYHAPAVSGQPHPEESLRAYHIFQKLVSTGCLSRCVRVSCREATVDELLLVHTKRHVTEITDSAALPEEKLCALAKQHDSLYLNSMSSHCARLACGGVIELCRTVYQGKIKNGMAIVRPPGHHAEPDEKAFLTDPNVLYFSIHRYDDAKFYPYETAAAHYVAGEGEGKGRTINVPWPCAGMGDFDYLHAFNKLLMPIAYEFDPEIVIVASGFNAASGDLMGGCFVTPACYAHLTHKLKTLAGGKVVLSLEGGYNYDIISESALACVRVLIGEDPPQLQPGIPSPICVETVEKVAQIHSVYWKSLRELNIKSSFADGLKKRVEQRQKLSAERSKKLIDEFGLLKLPIAGSNVPEFFHEEVFQTDRTLTSSVLVVFIHDMNHKQATSAQESGFFDIANRILGNILVNNWELIDVNIPYLDDFQDEDRRIVDRLISYIWDRYIKTTTQKKIVFVATGYGAVSVGHLITLIDDVQKYSMFMALIPGDELPMVPPEKSDWFSKNTYIMVDPTIAKQHHSSCFGRLVSNGRSATSTLPETSMNFP
ncbi:Arginase/deacetylase [Basidiobolus meristosporus CBS 931.73]|uniref:histone deacetylase n=1 Tax=Basidiobolus meristosporus CBS 931.73 TaxID=1314790 RepID=A0A1Y1Y0N9_9FUNG|nr:Arginase/deacetylase [Basidiobolus meristosporus CBS 931.73]|eukprot:ORX91194.1 Arginase/deacetylase [Basidiobolus meristosporus CBS 931.73]